MIHFNKVTVSRGGRRRERVGLQLHGRRRGRPAAGGWRTGIGTSHMTTPHYALVEGNESFNFGQDNTLGQLGLHHRRSATTSLGRLRSFPSVGPHRAVSLAQWHWWQSFVGNVLGSPSHPGINGYESHWRSPPGPTSCCSFVQPGCGQRVRRREVLRDAAARRQLRLLHRPGALARHRRPRSEQRADPARRQLDAAGVDVPVGRSLPSSARAPGPG